MTVLILLLQRFLAFKTCKGQKCKGWCQNYFLHHHRNREWLLNKIVVKQIYVYHQPPGKVMKTDVARARLCSCQVQWGALGMIVWLLLMSLLSELAGHVTYFSLFSRTCLFVQKKTGNSLVPFSFKGPRNRCQCLGGEAWAVAYRHTRVVICTTRGAPHHRPLHNGGGVAGGDDETSSDCSCLCHSYENLSSTNQSSLKSLISTIWGAQILQFVTFTARQLKHTFLGSLGTKRLGPYSV